MDILSMYNDIIYTFKVKKLLIRFHGIVLKRQMPLPPPSRSPNMDEQSLIELRRELVQIIVVRRVVDAAFFPWFMFRWNMCDQHPPPPSGCQPPPPESGPAPRELVFRHHQG